MSNTLTQQSGYHGRSAWPLCKELSLAKVLEKPRRRRGETSDKGGKRGARSYERICVKHDHHSVEAIGWADVFFPSFGISSIVWGACIAGMLLIFSDHTLGVRSLEIFLGAGFIFLAILPIGALSWIAVTGVLLLSTARKIATPSVSQKQLQRWPCQIS